MMDNHNDIIEFFNYVQPIVNGSFGFIKTEGYMTHFPGVIVAMSADETYCGIIHIPIIFNVYMTAEIGTFLQLKTDDVRKLENLYFVGNNVKNAAMMRYFYDYNDIDNKARCIYAEPDCYNIPSFDTCVGASTISSVRICDNRNFYVIPASKAITQAAKAVTVSLKLYDSPRASNIKTVRYTIYKKKFKLPVDIFSNILVF